MRTLPMILLKGKLRRSLRRAKNTIIFMWEYPKFKASCRRARQASEMHNRKKYYCMKLRGRYYEFCRDDINGLKRMGIMRKELTFLDIQKYACYQTQ